MASGQTDSYSKEGIIMTTLTVVRAGLFALTLVALGFVPGVSVAYPASVTGHGEFTATGTGNDNQVRVFSFSAIQQPNGKVAGQAEVHNRTTGVVVHMDVVCLHVEGNTAFVIGTITNSNDPTMEGRTVAFIAQDNGEGINSPSDKLSRPVIFADCSNLPNLTLDLFPIQNGNIQVRP